jgi:hypothetical protein
MNVRNNLEADDILERVARLEQAVFGSGSRPVPASKVKAGQAKALPDHILDLRDSVFFDSPKTASEVHQKLQAKYACELDRVSMALLRLQRRRQLRKVSKEVDGRTVIAYAR